MSSNIALLMAKKDRTCLKMGHQVFDILDNISTKRRRSFLTLDFFNEQLAMRFYKEVVNTKVEAKLKTTNHRQPLNNLWVTGSIFANTSRHNDLSPSIPKYHPHINCLQIKESGPISIYFEKSLFQGPPTPCLRQLLS